MSSLSGFSIGSEVNSKTGDTADDKVAVSLSFIIIIIIFCVYTCIALNTSIQRCA